MLFVARDALAVEVGVGWLPASPVVQHRHHRRQTAGAPGGRRGAIVDPQVRVAVEDEEALAEQLQGAPDRPEGAVEARRIAAVADANPAAAGADALLDRLPAIAGAEHDVGRAVGGEEAQLMNEERVSGHLQQRLGRIGDSRPQTCAQPAGKDAYRGEGHPHTPSSRGGSAWNTFVRKSRKLITVTTAVAPR